MNSMVPKWNVFAKLYSLFQLSDTVLISEDCFGKPIVKSENIHQSLFLLTSTPKLSFPEYFFLFLHE